MWDDTSNWLGHLRWEKCANRNWVFKNRRFRVILCSNNQLMAGENTGMAWQLSVRTSKSVSKWFLSRDLQILTNSSAIDLRSTWNFHKIEPVDNWACTHLVACHWYLAIIHKFWTINTLKWCVWNSVRFDKKNLK